MKPVSRESDELDRFFTNPIEDQVNELETPAFTESTKMTLTDEGEKSPGSSRKINTLPQLQKTRSKVIKK